MSPHEVEILQKHVRPLKEYSVTVTDLIPKSLHFPLFCVVISYQISCRWKQFYGSCTLIYIHHCGVFLWSSWASEFDSCVGHEIAFLFFQLGTLITEDIIKHRLFFWLRTKRETTKEVVAISKLKWWFDRSIGASWTRTCENHSVERNSGFKKISESNQSGKAGSHRQQWRHVTTLFHAPCWGKRVQSIWTLFFLEVKSKFNVILRHVSFSVLILMFLTLIC